jgi:RNA polymerase sigma factor (sigma-70 family)
MNAEFTHYADNALVAEAQAGNTNATEVLFNRHRDFVSKLVRKMGDSGIGTEDTTHDIFVRVLEHLKNFEHQSEFTTWLYRIAVNHVLQNKRKEKYLQKESLPDELNDTVTSEEQSYDDFLLDYFSGVLLCMNDEQRVTVVLADIFKMDHLEASAILKITPDNFRQRLSRSRKDLRHWVSKKCSLINPENPCRCPRKTNQYITQGWVNPQTKRFELDRIMEVMKYVSQNLQDSQEIPAEEDN